MKPQKLPQMFKKQILKVFLGLLLAVPVSVFGLSTVGLFNLRATQALAAPEVFQDELEIELGSNGFTPAYVQRTAGTFGIAVENSTLTGEYTLQLKAPDGTVVKEVQIQKGSAAWTVTLSAGEYTLTEASHSQWLCRIAVQ
ncbi:MAG TPA: hypothetical protein VN844_05855 [Pyrinomonadaceae bacterium]|nr:hypothetical protein [Pyrinomonadaceae bacterium]